uniref:Rad52/22 double-strand break repair protein n=1 Tax=viral metagenome TaxID=1070528 RepID=A0A6M3JTF4_9ZZZZ
MINKDEIKEIMIKLAEPLPEIGIQRTDKKLTKKGYDTVGYKSQFVVNRFNEVLGINWGFEYKILKEIEGTYGSGTKKIDIVIELFLWIIENKAEYIRKGIGGHTSFTYVDALKGAVNNALKRAGAYFGVGRQAWEETVDEDDDPAKCAFEDNKHQQEGKKPNNNSQDQQQPPQQTFKTQDQQPPKGKQETFTGKDENGNGGITSQKLCGMVAQIAGVDSVSLYKKYCYKQYNIKSLTEFGTDQLKAEYRYLKEANKRPADFKKFLDNYKEKPVITNEGLIKSIKTNLIKIFNGERDRIDFYFSGLCTSIATINDLSKLSEDELIDVFNKVEITYNEHNEHMEAQKQKAIIN